MVIILGSDGLVRFFFSRKAILNIMLTVRCWSGYIVLLPFTLSLVSRHVTWLLGTPGKMGRRRKANPFFFFNLILFFLHLFSFCVYTHVQPNPLPTCEDQRPTCGSWFPLCQADAVYGTQSSGSGAHVRIWWSDSLAHLFWTYWIGEQLYSFTSQTLCGVCGMSSFTRAGQRIADT